MVLIDYDSGVVVDRPEDAPTTFGKGDEWVAPEINAQRSQASDGQSTVTVDLLTDTWSVAVGVHYFLFACFPYFYLHVLGPRGLEAYVSRYRWPEVDPSYDNFEADNSEFYAHYRQTYAATQDSLKRPFEATFWKGADAISRNARASYRQWIQVLEPLVVRTRFRPPTTVSTLAAQPTPAAQPKPQPPPQPQPQPTRPAPGPVPRQTVKPPPTPTPPQPKRPWPRLVALVLVALVIGVIYTIGNKPRDATTWAPEKGVPGVVQKNDAANEAEKRQLIAERVRLNQEAGQVDKILAHGTMTLSGRMTTVEEPSGSGGFWSFSIKADDNNAQYGFMCSSYDELYFRIGRGDVDWETGRRAMRQESAHVILYFRSKDWDKCLTGHACDVNPCPLAIVIEPTAAVHAINTPSKSETITVTPIGNNGCGNRMGGFDAKYNGKTIGIIFTHGQISVYVGGSPKNPEDLLCPWPGKKLKFLEKHIDIVGKWSGTDDIGVSQFHAKEIFISG